MKHLEEFRLNEEVTYEQSKEMLVISNKIKDYIKKNYPQFHYTHDDNILGRYGHGLGKSSLNKISKLASKEKDSKLKKLVDDLNDLSKKYHNENTIIKFEQFINEAFVSKEKMKQVQQDVKKEFPEWKFSIRKENSSSINVHILSGPIPMTDKKNGYEQVNPFWYKDHYKDEPEKAAFFEKLFKIINVDNWDRSDSMTDYFDVGFYTHVTIGSWDKPYQVTTKNVKKGSPVKDIEPKFKRFDFEEHEERPKSLRYFENFLSRNQRMPSMMNKINKDQERFDHFLSLGVRPNNTPQNVLDMIKVRPETIFIDLSGELVDGDYRLQYDTTYRSVYSFNLIDLKSGEETGEKKDIMRGNLKNLRSIKMNQ